MAVVLKKYFFYFFKNIIFNINTLKLKFNLKQKKQNFKKSSVPNTQFWLWHKIPINYSI
jgi:hypothetical protein